MSRTNSCWPKWSAGTNKVDARFHGSLQKKGEHWAWMKTSLEMMEIDFERSPSRINGERKKRMSEKNRDNSWMTRYWSASRSRDTSAQICSWKNKTCLIVKTFVDGDGAALVLARGEPSGTIDRRLFVPLTSSYGNYFFFLLLHMKTQLVEDKTASETWVHLVRVQHRSRPGTFTWVCWTWVLTLPLCCSPLQ